MFMGLAVAGMNGQTFNEWKDPEINAVNRAPMRSANFAFNKEKMPLRTRK